MKKTIRFLIPLMLVLAIIFCTSWYLFIYDREFTRDMLLHTARYFESNGNHGVAAWFYDRAYKQSGDNDAVAIELAKHHKANGNYTKAEYTLSKAIADGGGVDLYIALCKTYVEQDKLLDAVNMLNHVTNQNIKAQLESLRPAAPVCDPDPITSGSYYTQYITVNISAQEGTLYVNNNGEIPSVKKDLYQQGITLVDGKNTLCAIAVADNGLVSPTAVFGFTVGGVIEKVTFADAAMEKAFREKLAVTAEKVLYTKDLWTITDFTVPTDAKSLADLRYLTFLERLTIDKSVSGELTYIANLSNLKELHITGTTVASQELPIIARLPNLEKLTLNNCNLSTTAGLELAKKLVYLDLGNNVIRNITSLSALENLQALNLQHNAVNNLGALSSLTQLLILDVSYNNLTTLSPITSVTSLTWLEAGYNSVKELNGFQNLTALVYLDMSYNALEDISQLASCSALSQLNVSTNALTDISALSGLNMLINLNFSNNKVSALPTWSAESALVSIDGSYNLLTTLEPLAGLNRLNKVLMDYNKEITSVNPLASCPLLIQVNVYGTKVTQVGALTSQSVVVNYDPTQGN